MPMPNDINISIAFTATSRGGRAFRRSSHLAEPLVRPWRIRTFAIARRVIIARSRARHRRRSLLAPCDISNPARLDDRSSRSQDAHSLPTRYTLEPESPTEPRVPSPPTSGGRKRSDPLFAPIEFLTLEIVLLACGRHVHVLRAQT